MKWSFAPVAEFAQWIPRWDALHRASTMPPIVGADFVAPLLEGFAGGLELLACCEHGGEVVAMAVLAPGQRGAWSTFQPAQAPLGIWLQRPGLDADAALAALLRALPGCALLVGVTQLDPLVVPRPGAGARRDCLDYIETARIVIDGSFDDYWSARGKNLRTNLKKQRARLDKEGIATRLEVSRSEHDMAQAVCDYGRLESAGWKAGAQTAVDASNAQGRFYRDMLERFGEGGAARAYRYWFGERLVAMDLCIEDAGCMVVLKTTYDETVPSAFSPAFLMREEICRALFDEGHLRRIEFYGKVMPWHLRWTEDVRTLYHLNYYRWSGLRQAHLLLRARRDAVSSPIC